MQVSGPDLNELAAISSLLFWIYASTTPVKKPCSGF
jgi:hypothetical protein